MSLSEKILRKLSILYVESDPIYVKNVSSALELKCEKIYTAGDINEAVNIYNNENIDIIITELEFGSNSDSGMKFIKGVRNINSDIPIIVLTKHTEIDYLLFAVRSNLVEYILKPIDLKILRDALFRSVGIIYDSGRYEICFSNGSNYNVRKKLLLSKDKELPLTQNEIKLLDFLIFNQNMLLSKDVIKNHIWENAYEISDEAFKSLLTRLRGKIGKEAIRNVSGSGYLLVY